MCSGRHQWTCLHGPAGRDCPISLTDSQLTTLMQTAGQLEPSKRDAFLQRRAAELVVRRGVRRPNDAELEQAARAALRGLLHAPAA
jgi:hypothetical protein